MSSISGLPSIPDSALPTAVRTGSDADKQLYKTAAGFESLLVGQLVEQMTQASDISEGPRADSVNDAMTEALTGAGGLGLAEQLYESMKLQEGVR